MVSMKYLYLYSKNQVSSICQIDAFCGGELVKRVLNTYYTFIQSSDLFNC